MLAEGRAAGKGVCATGALEAVNPVSIQTPRTCKGFCSLRSHAFHSSRVKGSRLV